MFSFPIGKDQKTTLDDISRKTGIPRAVLLRDAINHLIRRYVKGGVEAITHWPDEEEKGRDKGKGGKKR